MAPDLSALTAEERRDLYATLAFEFRDMPGETRAFSQAEGMLWEALRGFIPDQHQMGLARFVAAVGPHPYRDAADRLDALLTRVLPIGERRHVRDEVRRLAIGALVDYLRAAMAPISGSSIIRSFDHLEHAIDRQFPGYMAAGILHRVVKVVAA